MRGREQRGETRFHVVSAAVGPCTTYGRSLSSRRTLRNIGEYSTHKDGDLPRGFTHLKRIFRISFDAL